MLVLNSEDGARLEAARDAIARKEYSWAKFEVDRISEGGQAHPEVVDAAVAIYSGLSNHTKTVEAARGLIEGGKALDRGSVWLALADALHQLGKTQEAYDTLKEFAGYGTQGGLVHYRLAAYACLLGKSDEAKKHFTRAMATPEGARLKREAMGDERLRAIWDFLCEP
jgi:tetratricopeptide (TPR) repeat protein